MLQAFRPSDIYRNQFILDTLVQEAGYKKVKKAKTSYSSFIL